MNGHPSPLRPVVLLVEDEPFVRMPGSMDGLELASLVRSRWPHISVVITSGHLDPDNGMLPQEAVFIAKPYGEQAPAKAIRALLD
jgi:DNA-binding NarL/FixJ family response regulator